MRSIKPSCLVIGPHPGSVKSTLVHKPGNSIAWLLVLCVLYFPLKMICCYKAFMRITKLEQFELAANQNLKT